MLKSIR